MSEFKGTKGEWRISKDINDNERISIESESNQNFIDCWGLDMCTEDELKANAKLIAAAPELLNVLDGLVTDVSGLLSENDIEWQKAGYFNEAKLLLKEILG